MNTVKKAINVLNGVSNDLHGLTLEVILSNQFIDSEKSHAIGEIKTNIIKASSALDEISAIDKDMINTLDKVVKECISSIHEIHSNMKQDLIKQNAEDDYAELSAQMVYL